MSKKNRSVGHPVAATERLEPRTLFADIFVTTLDDSGPGSLRQAIIDANASPDADRPFFMVPDGSVFRPLSPLPVVTGITLFRDSVNSGAPRYSIDGSEAGPTADGLVFAEGTAHSEVNGFAIYGFGGSGIVTSARGTDGAGLNLLRCNIGVDAAGAGHGNGYGTTGSAGVKVLGGNVYLGSDHGVFINDPPIPAGTVAHNFGDGVQVNGGLAVFYWADVVDNAGYGVAAQGDASIALTGPDLDLYRFRIPSNVSRNGGGGVCLGPGAHNSSVVGCTVDNNGGPGVRIQDAANNRVLNTSLRRNAGGGVTIEGPAATQNAVSSNPIAGNGRWGVGLFNAAHDNVFGGFGGGFRQPSPANLIVANGSPGDSKSRASGVVIHGAGTDRNQFINNIIDDNTANGVEISDGASSNVFRGTIGATISGNAGSGVVISGADNRFNSFFRVLMADNGGIPIDLVTPPDGPVGPNPNDPLDADAGANGLLNHPVIASAERGADGTTTVRGSVDSSPLTVITVQLFGNRLPVTGDFGPTGAQAETYLGAVTTGTDASGHGEFVATFGGAGAPSPAAGSYVTALARAANVDDEGAADTSELSPGVRVGGAAAVQFVYLNGSAWAQRFRDYLAARGMGSAASGFALNSKYTENNPPAEVTWTNVNEVAVRFTEDVRVKAEDLRVSGERVGNYGIADFRYDPQTFTATWRLSRAVPLDKVTLALDASAGGVAARDDGSALDGNDDGAPGGGFSRLVTFVPGDVTLGGGLNALDLSDIRQGLNGSVSSSRTSAPFYDPFIDLDGSGRVDALDLAAFRRARALQAAGAAAPSVTASFFGPR